MSFKVTGSADMKARIAAAAKDFPKKVGGALYRVCEKKIMTRAKEEFVPVHLTTLQSTGRTDLPIYEGTSIIVKMGFGGPAAPYALAVHEHPSESDPPSWKGAMEKGKTIQFHPSGRGPEYLKKPLFEEAPTLLQDVAEDLRL